MYDQLALASLEHLLTLQNQQGCARPADPPVSKGAEFQSPQHPWLPVSNTHSAPAYDGGGSVRMVLDSQDSLKREIIQLPSCRKGNES